MMQLKLELTKEEASAILTALQYYDEIDDKNFTDAVNKIVNALDIADQAAEIENEG